MARLRQAVLRRVDHVWELGWFNLFGAALVGFFLWLTLMPLGDGIDQLRAERWGIGGTVSLSRCAIDDWARGDPWRCEGTFVSADATVRIDGVAYEENFDDDPRIAGEPVSRAARVSGPGSSSAWPPGSGWQASLISGIFCLFLTTMVLGWWVDPGEGRPAPAPATRRRPRSARPPARLRMRRRRR
ncbi:hypothetical protein KBX06_16175 [Micromonospora sp. C31]|uniref:hypothetical protein n=1 Tax=Micromonospora sp. C31 TaxID=2824876 RepID=UPI001B38AB73|nr:hypothetical protein [Micromonospora sp. C31]MBQ1074692.1 hypothetical protein [Micromonospora sp. C31]